MRINVQHVTSGVELKVPKTLKSKPVIAPPTIVQEFLFGLPTYSPRPNPAEFPVISTLLAADVALSVRPRTMPVSVPPENPIAPFENANEKSNSAACAVERNDDPSTAAMTACLSFMHDSICCWRPEVRPDMHGCTQSSGAREAACLVPNIGTPFSSQGLFAQPDCNDVGHVRFIDRVLSRNREREFVTGRRPAVLFRETFTASSESPENPT